MNTHPQHPENMSNEDIIAMACRIREDENAQLHVRPWKSRSRIAWCVAIPAACVVSFFLGYLLRPDSTGGTPQGLTAQTTTDTVYVQVHDTIYQTTDVHKPVRPRPITASTSSAPQEGRKIGISVLEDNIRYDLLAANHNDYY